MPDRLMLAQEPCHKLTPGVLQTYYETLGSVQNAAVLTLHNIPAFGALTSSLCFGLERQQTTILCARQCIL